MSQASNPFLDALRQAPRAQGDVKAALDILDEFGSAVEAFTSNRLSCVRIPGFITNLGPEYRIVLKPAASNVEHLLLRAHVPARGFPVRLDLYDEDLVECPDPLALRRELTDFLRRDTTVDVIDTLAA